MWRQRPSAEVVAGILEALFGESGQGGQGLGGRNPRAYPLAPFQEVAVGRVRALLARRGGAILADAVGLGKTYVALAIIEERLRAGTGDVVLAVPAALRRHWARPLRRVTRALTAGSITGPAIPPPRLVSHTQLSRGVAIRPAVGRRLVVVDEAHRFRNPATRRYGALARLAHGAGSHGRADVLLITATPVNNSLTDLYHLVRLFLRDDALRDVGVPSIRAVHGDGRDPDPRAVATLVREVVVRRTRSMVTARFHPEWETVDPAGAELRFPRRAVPEPVPYSAPGLGARVAAVEALELQAYPAGAAPLIRLGLLKRMDSDRRALALSLARLRASLRAFAEAADAGRLLRPGDAVDAGEGDPFQLALLGVVAEPAAPDLDLEALAASARRDLGTLAALSVAGPPGGPGEPGGPDEPDEPAEPDPKVAALIGLIEGLAPEKVVVFTEYRDTAETLWRALAPRFRTGRVDGSGAWLGLRRAGRRAVVERFAPAANGRPPPRERERVDVLVATDVLAEGLNLQDARHVVCYELPWNPVRLLQRIGRVDRLGSPHRVVVPYIFVPLEGLDDVLGLTRRVRSKLDAMSMAVGEERADELLEALARGRPGAVDRAIRAVEIREAGDPMERLRTLRAQHRRGQIQPPDAGSSDPNDLEAIVLVSVQGTPRLFEVAASGAVREVGPAAVALIGAALAADPATQPGTRGCPGPPRPLLERVLAHLARERVMARSPGASPPGTEAARVAGLVRRTLAAAGAAVHPTVVERAEALLDALATRPHPAQEAALAEARASAQEGEPPDRLLQRIETALGHHGATSPPRDPGAEAVVRAVLFAAPHPAATPPSAQLTVPGAAFTFGRLFPRSSVGRAGGC